MRVFVTRQARAALMAAAVVTAAIGAERVFAADAGLLALEDEWRRLATATVQDQARAHGVVVPGDGAVFTVVPDGRGTLGSAPASGGSHVLYTSRQAHRLKAGLYQVVVDAAGRARLLHFDPQLGPVPASLRMPPGDPQALHTPLGDDMCRNAPNLIMNFCQTFVACAGYGFFC